MSVKRIDKINSLLMRGISEIINSQLKDPRIDGIISVLNVKTSGDLKHADVFISIYGSENEKETFQVLASSEGFFRSELSKSLPLRTIPSIHFINDNSLEYSRKISDIIEGLK